MLSSLCSDRLPVHTFEACLSAGFCLSGQALALLGQNGTLKLVMAESKSTSYQVVARRFRPKAFAEVVGQEAALRSLRSALSSERIPHAFLFSGSRGVGKTTMARIMARSLNCEKGVSADPCGTCGACVSILGGSNPDVVEIDAASHNLVDDIRELRDRVGFASMGSRYKVYILDEVHMLTRSAFNAFLKTLEEPPKNVVFILATTELHKVPDTIRSRCQVLMFRRVGETDIVTRLSTIVEAEGLSIPEAVLEEIAASSRGGMRDSETALERILPMAHEMGENFDLDAYRSLVHRVGLDRTAEVCAELLAGKAAPALHFADSVVQSGVDEREALGEILEVLRAILLIKVDGPESTLVPHSGALRATLVSLAEKAETQKLDAMIQAGLLGRERIRRLDDRRLVLEMSLLRMAEAGQLPSLGDLARAVESGAVGAGPSAALGPPGQTGSSAPAGPAAGAGRTGDRLKAAFSAALKAAKPMLVSTLDLCRLQGPDGTGTVVLTLSDRRKFHQDRVTSPQVQDLMRQVLRGIAGDDINIRFQVGDSSAVEGQDVPTEELKSTSPLRPPSAVVRKVAERFDGKIMDLDDESPV